MNTNLSVPDNVQNHKYRQWKQFQTADLEYHYTNCNLTLHVVHLPTPIYIADCLSSGRKHLSLLYLPVSMARGAEPHVIPLEPYGVAVLSFRLQCEAQIQFSLQLHTNENLDHAY